MKFRKRSLVMMLVLVCMLAMLPLQAFAAKKSITLNNSKLTITVGKSKTLKATVTGPSKKVKWTSSKPAVATVNSDGKVTAKKAGKTTIKAKANGKTAKCVVTVEKANYKELYTKFLENFKVKAGKETINTSYFLVKNIDRKDVPELIIIDNSRWGSNYGDIFVYTVKSGKVKFLGSTSLMGVGYTPFVYYNKKYKGLYVGGWVNGVGGAWEGIYGISGSKLKLTRYAYEGAVSYGSSKMEYKIGPSKKKVTKAKYKSYCKKNKHMDKYETLYLYANNSSNRELYIK